MRMQNVLVGMATLMSASLLAWSASATLGPPLSATAREPARMGVRVVAQSDQRPRSFRPVVIRAILVDGMLRRWDGTHPGPDWYELYPDPFPRLSHHGSVPSAVEFDGRHAVIVFEASHHSREVELLRNGEVVERLDLYRAAPPGVAAADLYKVPPHVVVAELPALVPPSWVAPVSWACFLVLAAAVRPWASDRRKLMWVMVHLVTLNLLAWATQCIVVTNDTAGYLAGTKEFLEGDVAYFPPGYSLFVGLVDVVPGLLLGRPITLIQHGMMVLAGLWLYRLLSVAVGHAWAFFGVLLSGSFATVIFMPLAIMSESVAVFTCVGAVYFALRARQTGTLWPAVVSGLLVGWAGLARVVPLVAAGPAVTLIHLWPLSKQGFRQACVTFVVVAGAVLPTMLWFKVRDGHFALTNSMGGHLFNRVVHAQGLIDRDAPATAFLLHLLGDHPRWENHVLTTRKLEAKGVGYLDATQLLGGVAKEAIARRPFAYVAHSVEIARRQLFMNPFLHRWPQIAGPASRSTEKAPYAGFSKRALQWRIALERFQALIWLPLCWFAIVGLVVLLVARPFPTVLVAMACVPVGTLLGTAFVESAYDRYSAPLIPFLVALAVGGIGSLPAARGRFTRRRSVEPSASAA